MTHDKRHQTENRQNLNPGRYPPGEQTGGSPSAAPHAAPGGAPRPRLRRIQLFRDPRSAARQNKYSNGAINTW